MRVNSDYREVVLNTRGLVLYVPCADSGSVAREIKGQKDGTFGGTVRRLATSPTLRDMAPGFGFSGVFGSYVTGLATALPTGASADASWMIWACMSGTTPSQSPFGGFGPKAAPANGSERGIIRFPAAPALWGNNQDVTSSVDFVIGQRTHILCTKSGSTTGTIYVNGVQRGTSSAKTYSASSQDWWIAWRQGLTADLTNAVVGHLAVWDRTLTAAEAAHLYTEGIR